MPKEGWKSFTLKEETVEKVRKLSTTLEPHSLEDALEKVVLVIQNWRNKYLWDNWNKKPLEIEAEILHIENKKD